MNDAAIPVSTSELGVDLVGKGDTVTYKNKKYLVFQVLGSHAILKGIDDKNDTFIIKVIGESKDELLTDVDITELSNAAKRAYEEVKKLKKGTSEYSKAFEKWGALHKELTKAMYSGNTSRKIELRKFEI